MGLIVLQNITVGSFGDASLMAGNFGLIASQINGNLQTVNLANGAVTVTKLDPSLRGLLHMADGTVRRTSKGTVGISAVAAEQGPLAAIHGLPVTPSHVFLTGKINGAAVMNVNLTSIDATYFWFMAVNQPAVAISPAAFSFLAVE